MHWLVAIVVLARSTLLAVVLWSLRFTGLLGTGPLEALLLTAMDTEEDEMDNSPDCHRPTGDSGAPWGG